MKNKRETTFSPLFPRAAQPTSAQRQQQLSWPTGVPVPPQAQRATPPSSRHVRPNSRGPAVPQTLAAPCARSQPPPRHSPSARLPGHAPTLPHACAWGANVALDHAPGRGLTLSSRHDAPLVPRVFLINNPRCEEMGKPRPGVAPPSAHAPPSSPLTISPTRNARNRQPARPTLLLSPFSGAQPRPRALLHRSQLAEHLANPSHRLASCLEASAPCPTSGLMSWSLDDARSELTVETESSEPCVRCRVLTTSESLSHSSDLAVVGHVSCRLNSTPR